MFNISHLSKKCIFWPLGCSNSNQMHTSHLYYLSQISCSLTLPLLCFPASLLIFQRNWVLPLAVRHTLHLVDCILMVSFNMYCCSQYSLQNDSGARGFIRSRLNIWLWGALWYSTLGRVIPGGLPFCSFRIDEWVWVLSAWPAITKSPLTGTA